VCSLSFSFDRPLWTGHLLAKRRPAAYGGTASPGDLSLDNGIFPDVSSPGGSGRPLALPVTSVHLARIPR